MQSGTVLLKFLRAMRLSRMRTSIEIKQLNEPVIKDAAFAKQKGLVTEVKYIPFPQDAVIINIDY
jgi:hypothetical protein